MNNSNRIFRFLGWLLIALLGIAFAFGVGSCHSPPPRVTPRQLRAWCSIQAWQYGTGVTLDSLRKKGAAVGIQVRAKDSTLTCAAVTR